MKVHLRGAMTCFFVLGGRTCVTGHSTCPTWSQGPCVGWGGLLASQTMAAACQMVVSVSDSEMPTAMKNFLSENKSFYSGPIW